MKTTATNRKLRQLLTGIKNKTLIPRPDFQRRLVWANKHKISFLETVMEQYPFPEIYLAAGDVDPNSGEGTELLVDGQQRITTLYQYFTGSTELRLPKEIPPYSALGNDEKLAFLDYEVVVRDLGSLGIKEIKAVFQRINSTNYALNAMEISNARFEGEMKAFAEKMAQLPFFEKHSFFTVSELRRMHDLRFMLTVVITMMSFYFNRDDELEHYLQNFNDEFDEADSISHRLNRVLDLIDICDFPAKNRVWKKSDLFTLIIELDRQLNRHKQDLVPRIVKANLTSFYDLIDRIEEIPDHDPLLSEYYKASLQATNDRLNRVRRGQVIQLILSQKTEIDWNTWATDAGVEIVEEMVEWFFKHYKDPADGVPYDSSEGGYQYTNGGPYHAREVLAENFPDVPEELLDRAAERTRPSGSEWVKKDQY